MQALTGWPKSIESENAVVKFDEDSREIDRTTAHALSQERALLDG